MLFLTRLVRAFAGMGLLVAVAAGTARAGEIVWDTDGACATGLACNSTARTFLGSDGTTKVVAKAWSLAGGLSGVAEGADIGHWLGWGLGVINEGESGTSPNHAVDNYGRFDMVAFFFDEVVDITAASLRSIWTGSHYGDTDISVWIGTETVMPDLTGATLTSLDAMYGGHFDNTGPRETRTAYFNADGEAGNFLLIGAQMASADRDDFFKIKALQAFAVEAPPDGGGGAVPEPSSMAVFGIGVLGIAALRRRRARVSAQ